MCQILRRFFLHFALVLGIFLLLCGCRAGEGNGTPTPTPTPSPEGGDIPTPTPAPSYLSDEPEEQPNTAKEGVWVYYCVNSSAAGKLTGVTEQNVTGGKKTTTVTAKANLGYRFVRWSDGVTETTRPAESRFETTVLTAIFDYELFDLPVMLLTTETGEEVQSKTEYIGGTVSVLNAGVLNLPATANQIRGRGNNTWTYEKKSYKLHFDEKISLLNVGKAAKSWILMANVCDQSLLRNQTAMELISIFDGIVYEPSSRSVELYLNGEYRGVYLLAEEITVSSAHVDLDDSGVETKTDTAYLVETSYYATDVAFTIGNKQFEIKSDLSSDPAVAKKQREYIADYMKSAYRALQSGKKSEAEKYINVSSLVDAYIAEEILKNLDMGWDSFYFNKDAGGKLNFGPIWDFDLTLGNGNETCEKTYNLYCATWYADHLSNQWFYAAMQNGWFRELVTKRWDDVYAKVRKMPAYVLENGAAYALSYERNFKKWRIFGTVQNRETNYITSLTNYTMHYQYLAQWLEERIDWLQDFYHSEDYDGGGISFSDGDDAAAERAEKLYRQLQQSAVRHDVSLKTLQFSGETIRGETEDNLFDGDVSTKLCMYTTDGDFVTLRWKTETAVTVVGYAVCTANDTNEYPNRNPRAWRLYGSEDGKTWELLDFVGNATEILGATKERGFGFAVNTPDAYSYYRMDFFCRDMLQIGEIALYTE